MKSEDRKIICSAPGRAGIIGNPSDMYGGAVISCSLGLRARVSITPSSVLTFVSGEEAFQIQGTEELNLKGDRFDIARAILMYLGLPDLPCRLEYESSIPMRSGLAGSTALLVALLHGLLAWQEKYPNQYQLAEMARFIERNHLEVVCGYQDAYMSVFGGLNDRDVRGKQSDQAAEAAPYATLEPLGSYVKDSRRLPFLLASTGVQRVSGAVHKPLRDRWLDGDREVVQGYERITELAQLGKKALLNSDWAFLGELMNENHAIQRNLGGAGEANERLISAALQAGALGAKLAGAGEGGTIIALWPHHDKEPLEQALRKAGAMAIFCPVIEAGVTIDIEKG
jgi:galactokinase/mevalonate kinase-like predicted kinase